MIRFLSPGFSICWVRVRVKVRVRVRVVAVVKVRVGTRAMGKRLEWGQGLCQS